MNSTGEQAVGNDITGTSDAIVMASAPDIALPMETQSAADSVSQQQREMPDELLQSRPMATIAAAGAAGLLVGVALKKSLPALKGRY